MRDALVPVAIGAAVAIGVYLAWRELRSTEFGRELELGAARARAELNPTPGNFGKLAALEVRESVGLYPKPPPNIAPVAFPAWVARNTDEYGRPPKEQAAAIAAAVAERAARDYGLGVDAQREAANVAVRQFGYQHTGFVTRTLRGRTDWAQAITIMAAAVGTAIAAAATGGAAGAVVGGGFAFGGTVADEATR